MRKFWNRIIFAVVLVCFALPGGVRNVAAKQASYMNLYGISVNSTEKGDSVLVESDGEFLVMDLGMSSHLPAICRQLDAVGATHIDLYFSHLHVDHVGGSASDWLAGLKYLYRQGFVIDTLYLPNPALAPESAGYPEKYELLRNFMDSYMGGRGKIVYLEKGSAFDVGSAEVEVLGPSYAFVGSIHPSDYWNRVSEGDEGTEYGDRVMDTYYENNCSLITRVSGGGIEYLTTGDMLKDEAEFMVQTYGDDLKADIYKMPHHGTATGNTEEMFQTVNPIYSFAQNAGFSFIEAETNQWRFYNACQLAREVSMPYFIANEGKTIIYHAQDGQVSLYQGSTIEEGKRLEGWVSVYGADGKNRRKDCYYLGEDGLPATGVQTIGSHAFSFNKGGCMDFGDFDEQGVYNPWKTYTDGRRRYFELTDMQGIAYMKTGFNNIDGKTYYFDPDGVWLEGSGSFELLEIENSMYGIKADGAVTLNEVVDYDDQKYYFAKDGKMAVQQFVMLDGMKCYFGSYGTQVFDRFVFLDGKNYYIDEDGEVAANQFLEIRGKNYYFYSDGEMACKKIVSDGAEKLYFGKFGTQVFNKIVKVGKKQYYFDSDGYMVRDQLCDISGKTYYFDQKGVMAVKKLVSYEGDDYYFGKYGTMVRSKKVRIDGAAYYFGADGVMYKDTVEKIGKKTYEFDKDGKMKVVK